MTTNYFKVSISESPPKTFHNGTHRLIAPDKTVEKVRRFMQAMGITRIANVTGLDCIGIPVVMVCRPNSRSLAVSQGKGLNLAAAKASGLMEAVESYHAEHITLPLKYASYEELRYTHRIVDVTELPRISNSLFHPNLRLLWIEGHDLLQDELVWVPYEMVHTDYTLPLPAGSGCFPLSSNGLASGNHLLEAISHAICEVVERDSTSLWLHIRKEAKHKTRIDLDAVDDLSCLEVLNKFEQANVGVAVWETTSDIGIPSFLCTITERTEEPLRLLYSASGMGCHPARYIALLRALTEAAQSRLTYIAGSRDDTFRNKYKRARDPDVLRLFRTQLGVQSMRNFCDAPTWETQTLDEDVDWELNRLQSAGIKRVVIVDLTKPEFLIPVVRVVIPGLEGSDEAAGYTPGRRARKIIEDQS